MKTAKTETLVDDVRFALREFRYDLGDKGFTEIFGDYNHFRDEQDSISKFFKADPAAKEQMLRDLLAVKRDSWAYIGMVESTDAATIPYRAKE